MKRFKRIVSIILMIGIVISSSQVFANSHLEKYIGEPNITEEFKAWLELSEEEKGNVLMPRSYDVLDYKYTYNNPIRLAQTIGSATLTEYDLRDYIPENVTIKNQNNVESFYNHNDDVNMVQMMYSIENIYLENKYATGFIKNFENNKYSFVGILPKKTDELFELSNLDIDSLLHSKNTSEFFIKNFLHDF